MQRAQFDVENEHARGRLRARDVARELKRIDGGITAHEADHGALDRGRQLAALDHLVIEARRGKAGTASDQEMRDAVAFGAELQTLDRGVCELWRVALETAHASCDVWEIAAPIETLAVDRFAFRAVARRQAGIAVLDAGLVRHALKEQATAAVAGKQRLGEPTEGVVHVIGRHRRGNAVVISCGHSRRSRSWPQRTNTR